MRNILVLLIFFIISSSLVASETKTISIFYKNRKPSLKVLTRVDSLLAAYEENYTIKKYDIEAEDNLELIRDFGLPETHFPFAILIGKSFTANIEDRSVSFIHFPLFMHGIGRHEGNWSLEDLEKALRNNSLLNADNILIELEEEDEISTCGDE